VHNPEATHEFLLRQPARRPLQTGMVAPWHLARIAARQFQQEAVYPVEEWRARQEHERAVALDQAYALLMAKVGSLFADGTLAAPAMHPNTPNTGIDAVSHHTFRVSGPSHYQRTLSGWINLLNAAKTPPALQFTGSWIYRDHVITLVTHLSEELATEILWVAGYADEGDASLVEEIANFSNGGGHRSRPPPDRINQDSKP
jgi:hypothetical protein